MQIKARRMRKSSLPLRSVTGDSDNCRIGKSPIAPKLTSDVIRVRAR